MKRLRHRQILTPLLLASVLFVWFMSNVPYQALAQAGLDDALFVRGAANLLAGRWLGPYDDATLAKGPFFSVFLAACRLLNSPIFAAEAAVMAGAGLLLIDGLAQWIQSRTALAGIFLLYLFSPFIWMAQSLRVVREGIYGPLVVLILGLAVHWLADRRQSAWVRIGWAASLGGSIGLFWITREEGPWILPALLALFAYAVVTQLRTPASGQSAARVLTVEVLLAGCSLTVAVATIYVFAMANLYVYGVPNTVEIHQPEFNKGFSALSRVESDSMPRYVRLTPDALAQAASVSPAAAALRPILEAQRARWAEAGCETLGITPCDGQFRGGWAIWAVRNAVFAGGLAHDAIEARSFYRTLGQEITEACEARRIPCGRAPSGAMPAPSLNDIGPTWASFRQGLGMVATLAHLPPQPFSEGRLYHLEVFRQMVPGSALPRSGDLISVATTFQTVRPVLAVTVLNQASNTPGSAPVQTTTRVSHEVNPSAAMPFSTAVEFETGCVGPDCVIRLDFADGHATLPMQAVSAKGAMELGDITVDTKRVDSTLVARIFPARTRDFVVLGALNKASAPYGRAIGLLVVVALAGFMIRAVAAAIKRQIEPIMAIEFCLLALIVSRLGLLAFLDATGWPSMNPLYLSVVYPLVLLFAGISITSTVGLGLAFRQGRLTGAAPR